MNAELALDVVLVAGLVAVAIRAIHASALFTAIVLYIAFGLLMALVWVRLDAPDLALAEAAIGAGVTGALLLDAAGQLGAGSPLRSHLGSFARWMVGTAAFGLAIVVSVAAYSVAERRVGLLDVVQLRMNEAGVDHAVTAVLLNFRAYDTWLEVGVLLAAGVGLLALARVEVPTLTDSASVMPHVVRAAGSIIVPIAILAGGYLLWRGTHGPGGAFQAGAVLAAAGILAILAGIQGRVEPTTPRIRLLLCAGFLLFLLAGLLGPVLGHRFLEYPGASAGPVILIVEVAIAVSTAATLILLFVGARPGRRSREDSA